MKPIKLTMQAFGPFAQTETIEFDKLGTNLCFLSMVLLVRVKPRFSMRFVCALW